MKESPEMKKMTKLAEKARKATVAWHEASVAMKVLLEEDEAIVQKINKARDGVSATARTMYGAIEALKAAWGKGKP